MQKGYQTVIVDHSNQAKPPSRRHNEKFELLKMFIRNKIFRYRVSTI